jgi:hypothetical protein
MDNSENIFVKLQSSIDHHVSRISPSIFIRIITMHFHHPVKFIITYFTIPSLDTKLTLKWWLLYQYLRIKALPVPKRSYHVEQTNCIHKIVPWFIKNIWHDFTPIKTVDGNLMYMGYNFGFVLTLRRHWPCPNTHTSILNSSLLKYSLNAQMPY